MPGNLDRTVGTSCLKYDYLTLRTRNGTFHQEWVLKEAFSQSAGDQLVIKHHFLSSLQHVLQMPDL